MLLEKVLRLASSASVLEQLRVGHDDGQRGFQLVGGGRDELPLLLPGPLHRAHRPLGEQNADP